MEWKWRRLDVDGTCLEPEFHMDCIGPNEEKGGPSVDMVCIEEGSGHPSNARGGHKIGTDT
eukprot:9323334-Ditylum_brightwellii.AAC.1